MSMTKDEFCNALRFYASKEFEDIPTDDSEIDFEFSDEFNRKMEQLLKRVRYDRTHIVSWATKKIIVIAAALILVFAGMMSVSAIREPIVDLVTEIYQGFVEIFFKGDTSNTISYRYSFSELPEGFVETQRISEERVNVVRYEDTVSGGIIEFKQTVTEESSFFLDTDNGIVKEFDVDGKIIKIFISNYDDYFSAFWTTNSYYFELTYSGKTTVDYILLLIRNIE